jgi:hypothetical protein
MLPVGIDTLKSTIGRRGGIARGNRFAVYITHPNSSNNTLLNFDATNIISNLVVGNSIGLGTFVNDPRDMFLLCESVSIPGKRIATTEQVHNHHMEKMPYSAITEEVTMTFLLTNDYHTKKYFDSWQEMVVDTSTSHYRPSYKKSYTTDIIIQQLSASNDIIPGYTVRLEKAYPLQVSSVELSNSAENSTISVSVTLEYDIWREVGLIDGFNDLINRGKGLIGNTINQISNLI